MKTIFNKDRAKVLVSEDGALIYITLAEITMVLPFQGL
jgi:hypothetical protein